MTEVPSCTCCSKAVLQAVEVDECDAEINRDCAKESLASRCCGSLSGDSCALQSCPLQAAQQCEL
eukprot:6488702-Amphidinium_carterae.1